MRRIVWVVVVLTWAAGAAGAAENAEPQASLVLHSRALAQARPSAGGDALQIDRLFYETDKGRVYLPDAIARPVRDVRQHPFLAEVKMADGRFVQVAVLPDAGDFTVHLSAQPNDGIVKWGLSVAAGNKEVLHRLDGTCGGRSAAGLVGAGHFGRHESARAERGYDRQADHVRLCAVLHIVARLCGGGGRDVAGTF